jgi:TrmH family RNA methyltransferase
VITSASNPRIRLVRRLASRRQREREGLFVCEGEDLVAAGLEAGAEPALVFVDAERPLHIEGAEPVAPALLAEISSLGHHARVLAVFRRIDLPHAAAGGGLALWRVADPGNVGTLLRAADAFGAGYVALSAGCADPTGPKALRAAAGAIFRVAVIPFDRAPRPWTALATRRSPMPSCPRRGRSSSAPSATACPRTSPPRARHRSRSRRRAAPSR